MGWKNLMLGLEGLVHWLFRRSIRRHAWRRKNGRRWVLDGTP